MPGTTRDSLRQGSSEETGERWARIWFEKLARFHRVEQPECWQFTDQDVIEYLRSRLKSGTPAWKRLRIVEGLITYRNRVSERERTRFARDHGRLAN